MRFLSDAELAELAPAETASFPSPVPTEIVASDEYFPPPQSEKQREVEARLKALGSALAKKQGMSRRRFFETAAGMASSFLVMNEVYGPLFEASRAEAATPELADARAAALAKQFVMDTHTHFLRDDTHVEIFVKMRAAVGKAGWNKALADKEQTIDDLKFDNYFKEIFLDSDTKVALISSAPSDVPGDWFLTNEMMASARERVNKKLGGRRLLSHFIITPGQPGWLEALQRGIASSSRTRSRAIPSATTPTRTQAAIPGASTTRSSSTPPTRSASRRESGTSASTRACSRPRWMRSSPICGATST